MSGGAGFGEPAQFGKHGPLDFDVLEGGFDYDVSGVEARVVQLRLDIR